MRSPSAPARSSSPRAPRIRSIASRFACRRAPWSPCPSRASRTGRAISDGYAERATRYSRSPRGRMPWPSARIHVPAAPRSFSAPRGEASARRPSLWQTSTCAFPWHPRWTRSTWRRRALSLCTGWAPAPNPNDSRVSHVWPGGWRRAPTRLAFACSGIEASAAPCRSPSSVAGEGGEHRAQRRRDDVGMDTHAPPQRGLVAGGLHVRDGGGVGALADGVLRVVDYVEIYSEPGAEGVHESGDGAVALAGHRAGLPVHHELRGDAGAIGAALRHLFVAAELVGRLVRQVHRLEGKPHVGGTDLGAAVLRDVLDGLRELDLEPAGQVEAVLGLHDEGDAALARLAIDADDRLVGPAHVLGIDGEIRHFPDLVVLGQGLHALLDGVLVRPREGGVHEVAHVWMPRVHGKAVAVLGDPTQPVDVGDVELRIDALGEEVHGQADDVHVPRALAVAEQRALDAVGAREHPQLRRGHRAAAVVVGVKRQHEAVAAGDLAQKPLDGVGIQVG